MTHKFSEKQIEICEYLDTHDSFEFYQSNFHKRTVSAMRDNGLIIRINNNYQFTDYGLGEWNRRKIRDANRKHLEREFYQAWLTYGNDVPIFRDEPDEREHVKILKPPDHRKRFDFVIPDYMIAIEIQGGTWMGKSGHNTGTGIARDSIKGNLAREIGWVVMTFTSDMLSSETKRHDAIRSVLKTMSNRFSSGHLMVIHDSLFADVHEKRIVMEHHYGTWTPIYYGTILYKPLLRHVLKYWLWSGGEHQKDRYRKEFVGSENLLSGQTEKWLKGWGLDEEWLNKN